jgi:pimeloyl-ACP methyl ester carboxylesterase
MNTGSWPKRKTAVLVIHGIGGQYPFSTMDQFARSLIDSFEEMGLSDLAVEHCIAKREKDAGGYWNDNYIRVINKESEYPVDIYEYYWAHLTEEKMKLKDIQRWVLQTVKGAEKFYKQNEELARKCGDKSAFFTEEGKFKVNKYRAFLVGVAGIVPVYTGLWLGFASLISKIPVVGAFGEKIIDILNSRISSSLVNVLGDIAIYNSIDPKSSFYRIRKEILSGAVDTVKYLLELQDDNNILRDKNVKNINYGRVILAGHSLGSQIAFDTINRLTQMISSGEIAGVGPIGNYLTPEGNDARVTTGRASFENVSEQLCGLVTFGSPLDKIAFFLRQQAPDEQYLRLQILQNYHSFKQKEWLGFSDIKYRLESPYKRIFDNIRWYNYHDAADPISGRLDYYGNVINRRRSYKKKWRRFTHGDYWIDKEMFREIITDFIIPEEPTEHIQGN